MVVSCLLLGLFALGDFVELDADLPTLPVFPGVSKVFIKSPGLPVRAPNLPGTTYCDSFYFILFIYFFINFVIFE